MHDLDDEAVRVADPGRTESAARTGVGGKSAFADHPGIETAERPENRSDIHVANVQERSSRVVVPGHHRFAIDARMLDELDRERLVRNRKAGRAASRARRSRHLVATFVYAHAAWRRDKIKLQPVSIKRDRP